MIVVPMLIGVFAGRWLDRPFHSGLFWTAPLLMLGRGARLLVRLEVDAAGMNLGCLFHGLPTGPMGRA